MEEISEEECLSLLEQNTLGRIAVVVSKQPQIFPVNYAMSGGIVVFRTSSGTKLFNAPEAKVAFEIDGYEPSTGVGWSVMVQGVAHDATDSYDDISWAARAASPEPQAPGARPYRIAIKPTRITGRRFHSAG
jgi:nitroimidazol reductase NimA-like FMN-containing flavoprotein (pyridoxamine 5'-phosphate oxidase superfamily)